MGTPLRVSPAEARAIFAKKKLGRFGEDRSAEYGGVRYHSKLEARHARWLDCEKAAGRVLRWERQVRIPLTVPPRPMPRRAGFWLPAATICVYVADFVVDRAGGLREIHECKGFETYHWKLKRKLLNALYLADRPEWSLVMVT